MSEQELYIDSLERNIKSLHVRHAELSTRHARLLVAAMEFVISMRRHVTKHDDGELQRVWRAELALEAIVDEEVG